jgi:hypothetical protein
VASWTQRLRELFAQRAGGLAADDWTALVAFMRFRECPVAHKAIEGRQGCTTDQCSALADELRVLRNAMLARGEGVTYVERSDWQELVERGRTEPAKLDGSDLYRLVIVADDVPGTREHLAARLPELHASERLVLGWAITNRFDRALANEVVAMGAGGSDDWKAEAINGVAAWMLLLEPSPLARAHFAFRAKRFARDQRAHRPGEDGDADEAFELERAQVILHRAVLAAWDKGRTASLDDAFRTFQQSTFHYWTAEQCVTAACVASQLAPRSATDALAGLRALVTESTEPPAPTPVAEDPAYRALDALAKVVELGRGLTVRFADGRVHLEPRPQRVDPDYF